MGHGKAILDVQLHGDDGREEIILSACRHCTLFDYLFDEGKGWFLAELLIATGRAEDYLHQLIPSTFRGRHDLNQWADLLSNLAKRGFSMAQQYLIENWREALNRDQLWLASAYVESFGEVAYREVLSHAQSIWRNRRTAHRDAFRIHSSAEDGLGERRAKLVRRSLATANPRFAKIAEFPGSRIADPAAKAARDARRSKSINEQILEGSRVFRRDLTVEEVDIVAKLLETDLEPKPARAALHLFRCRPFPGDLAVLRTWADCNDEELSCYALSALGANRDLNLRELASMWCDDDYKRSGAMDILVSNFVTGDEVWIEEQLRRNKTKFWFHNEILSALGVIEANPKGRWVPLLRYMLDRVPCQTCRGTVVSRLLARRALTDADIEALSFDASSSNRKHSLKVKRRRSKAKASLPQSPESQTLHA